MGYAPHGEGARGYHFATSGTADYNEGAFVRALQPIPKLASTRQTDTVLG